MSYTSAETFTILKTRTREILEDANAASYQWSDTIVERYLNDAAQDFAIRTKCIRKYSTPLANDPDFRTLGTGTLSTTSPNQAIVTSLSNPTNFTVGSYIYSINTSTGALTTGINPGTTVIAVDVANSTLTLSANATAAGSVTLTDSAFAFYTMPADIHELEGVWVNGYHVPQARADRLPYQWDIETCSSTSDPTAYIYGDYGLSVVRFWPFPSNAAFTDVKIYYTGLPPSMTSGGGSPVTWATGIPDRYAVALVYYAVAMCYRRNFEDNDRRKSEEFMALYLDQVRDCQGRIERLMNAEGMGVPYRHI